MMCSSKNQTIESTSFGFIKSRNHPYNSPLTGGQCTVSLVVENPLSLEIKVAGQFNIPTSQTNSCNRSNKCCYSNRFFWIDNKRKQDSTCGTPRDGAVIKTVDKSLSGHTTVVFGYQLGQGRAKFRVAFTGEIVDMNCF